MNKAYNVILLCLLITFASTQEEGELVTVSNPQVICSLVPEYPITSFGSISENITCDCEYQNPIEGGYYYDAATQQCTTYFASCCGFPSPNSFDTLEQCQETCQGVQTLSNTSMNPFTICSTSPSISAQDGPSSISVFTFIGQITSLGQFSFSCQEVSISESTNTQGQNLFSSSSICEQFCEPYTAMMLGLQPETGPACECETELVDSCYLSYDSTTGVCNVYGQGCCTSYRNLFNSDASGCVCPPDTEFEGGEEDDEDLILINFEDMEVTCDCIITNPPCLSATFDSAASTCNLVFEQCCGDEKSSYSANTADECECPDNEFLNIKGSRISIF